MRKFGGGDDGRVGDVHGVVQLVAFFQATQNGHRALHVRFVHQHLLEAPFQRRVLLDVLAVLVQRSGADAVQLAARQRGFQHVAGVHRALGLARAHHRVQLVDEQDHATALFAELVQHGFQAFFELAAELRAGDERTHVERQNALVLEALRHFAVEDALRQSLHDGGLAHARLADEHRIVLGAALQHLHRAANLLVAANHRIERAGLGAFGEIDGVLGERLAGVFGAGVAYRLAVAGGIHRLLETRHVEAGGAQGVLRRAAGVAHRRQDQLRGNKAVAALLRRPIRQIQDAGELRRRGYLAGGLADARQILQAGLHVAAQAGAIHAGAPQQAIDAAIFQQCGQHVQRFHRRMVASHRQRLRRRQRRLQTRCEFVQGHVDRPMSPAKRCSHASKCGLWRRSQPPLMF